MNWQIDHLAIVGDSLAEATAWVQERLGTGLAPGGVHPHMGTHNRLLSLGPDAYLEAIAINTDVPPPVHARWFGMDWFSGPNRRSEEQKSELSKIKKYSMQYYA